VVARLVLPSSDYKAYLFDCDGTVADSMPLHYLAWCEALAEWRCVFDEDRFYAWGGMPAPEIIDRLAREQGLDLPAARIADRKEALYLEHLPQLTAVPEVLEHVLSARGRIPCAVVSGSPRVSVEATLGVLGLADVFDTLVCAGDYVKSKPSPEPYLMAAGQLGVAPAQCLVFEDTQFGVDAAVAAGMGWVRVPPAWERGTGVDAPRPLDAARATTTS
jgi:HAD superfamily hydrolase (TIGR01509 family)